ncbi:MAG TPA: 5-oxoprolinase subunit PxpB [Lacunisphaera sp.]|jgi:inhibitor of KinA
MQITPLGDTALMLGFGDVIDESVRRRVHVAWQVLQAAPLPAVTELVPAYTTVTLFYDPMMAVQEGAPETGIVEWLTAKVRERLKNPPKTEKSKPRSVEIPICYGGEFGPDLGQVAKHAKLSPEEVIKRHGKADYIVYMIGFAPGFPYLGGLPKELNTPRHAKPRMNVAPGSVGIAGNQTGIYPLGTPGGWNLIGRTPLKLFVPDRDPPVLLCAGDGVRFRTISSEEFAKLEASK